MDHAGNQAQLTFRLEREVEPSGLSAWWIVVILVVIAAVGVGLWVWTQRRSGSQRGWLWGYGTYPTNLFQLSLTRQLLPALPSISRNIL